MLPSFAFQRAIQVGLGTVAQLLSAWWVGSSHLLVHQKSAYGLRGWLHGRYVTCVKYVGLVLGRIPHLALLLYCHHFDFLGCLGGALLMKHLPQLLILES